MDAHHLSKEKLALRVRVFSLIFGLVWLTDAIFKWLPGFMGHFEDFVTNAAQGQPAGLAWWFSIWIGYTKLHPLLCAVVIASVETLVALSLLLGIFRKPMYIIGALTSIVIWGAAEGFGGPYGSGATDIGAAIMYVFVFAALWGLEQFTALYSKWTLDAVIARKWSFWKKVGLWEEATNEPSKQFTHSNKPVK